MAKKTNKQIETSKEQIPGTNELTPPVVTENQQQNTGAGMDADFEAFKKGNSEFIPDAETNATGVGTAVINKPVTPTPEQQLKIKLFAGFALYMIAGLNTFIFNKVSKTDVPLDEMLLEDSEEEALLPYLNSVEVLTWIDKLPIWVVGFLHMEYMFYIKFNSVKSDYKKIQQPKKQLEESKKERGGKK